MAFGSRLVTGFAHCCSCPVQLPCAAHAEHLFIYLLATSLIEDIVVGARQTHHCFQTFSDIVMASVLTLNKWQSEGFIALLASIADFGPIAAAAAATAAAAAAASPG